MTNEFGFIELCKQYYGYSTDAPSNFGELIGIQLLGHAMGYDAVHLIIPKAVHHNMYALLTGDSTLTRKSTTQGLGMDIYPYERCLPQETSPEQFVVELSEKNEAMQFLPEFTALIKGATRRGSYMARFVELYNDLHGCPKRYHRKLRAKKGEENEFLIEKAYLSVNSTVTPEMLMEKLTFELAVGGFLARWLLVYGEPKTKPRRRLHESALKLNESLKYQIEAIVRMNRKVEFEFTDEALKRFNEIEAEALKVEHAKPFAGRYLNYVVAIADILLVSDAIGYATEQGKSLRVWTQLVELVQYYTINTINTISREPRTQLIEEIAINPTNSTNCIMVPIEYVDRAWEIVKPCLEYANEIVKYVGLDKDVAKLRKQIKKAGKIGHSKAMVNANLNADQMKNAVKTLLQRGEIRQENEDVERTGSGKITKNVYHWIGEEA